MIKLLQKRINLNEDLYGYKYLGPQYLTQEMVLLHRLSSCWDIEVNTFMWSRFCSKMFDVVQSTLSVVDRPFSLQHAYKTDVEILLLYTVLMVINVYLLTAACDWLRSYFYLGC